MVSCSTTDMSDLVSTPSQTPSAVSNEAFETLIDLLASDGIDEDPSPLPRDRAGAQPTVTLRDPSGKLDFDKIRLMFTAQNHRGPAAPEPPAKVQSRVQSPAIDDGGGDSDSNERNKRFPPKPTERVQIVSGHRRSSTFGNQPWVANHENGAPAKEDVTPAAPQPLSFEELNAALAGAHEEVMSLRQKYEELRVLVPQCSGAERRGQMKLVPSTIDSEQVAPGDGRTKTRNAGSHAQPSAAVPPKPLPSDIPDEIANLSEDSAKRALSALMRSLDHSRNDVGPMATRARSASTPQNLSSPHFPRQHDVASIVRAVKFLGTVDELVWRRASGPSGPRTLLPVYSEENVVALLARLELWERAVRRSSRA